MKRAGSTLTQPRILTLPSMCATGIIPLSVVGSSHPESLTVPPADEPFSVSLGLVLQHSEFWCLVVKFSVLAGKKFGICITTLTSHFCGLYSVSMYV